VAGATTRVTMLEAQVANLLEKILGPFVRGLDKQSLKLSIWSGDVLLHGLQLRTEALDALPIPLKAIGGTLGEVRVKVPWRSLGKEPLIISIDRVFLVVGPKAAADGYNEQEETAKAEHSKREALEAWEAVQDNKERNEKMGSKMAERLTLALLGQLQVSVTNVHVRIEGTNEGALAGGVVLRALKLSDLSTGAVGGGLQAGGAHPRRCLPHSLTTSSWAPSFPTH
jgi:vacuolar protein sorting-associated protein 13A/C